MVSLRRLRILILVLAGLSQVAAQTRREQGVGNATTAEDLPPELKALLDSQPSWTVSTTAFAAVGYNDNLLLTSEELAKATGLPTTGFARAGADAFLWHMPKDRIDYLGMFSAEYTRFFHRATDSAGQEFDSRSFARASLEWRYQVPEKWSLVVDGLGYYQNEIFDVSDTEIKRIVAELEVTGIKVWPTLRRYVRPSLWVEGSVSGNRETFRGGAYDATMRGALARIGWSPVKRFEFTLTGSFERRGYDERRRYNASGRVTDLLPGFLVVRQRELEGRAKLKWGSTRQWTTTTRIAGVQFSDNAEGYFDYRQRSVSQEVEWAKGRWTVSVEGRARRRDYEVQTSGEGGVSPPLLIRDDYSATARVERTLRPSWTLFVEYTWERSRSNDVLASYRVNEGLLGLRWSWDK